MYRLVIAKPGWFIVLVLFGTPGLMGGFWGVMAALSAPNPSVLVVLPIFAIGGVIVGFVPALLSLFAVGAIDKGYGLCPTAALLIGAATTTLCAVLLFGWSFLFSAIAENVWTFINLVIGCALLGALAALVTLVIGGISRIVVWTRFAPIPEADGAGGSIVPDPNTATGAHHWRASPTGSGNG